MSVVLTHLVSTQTLVSHSLAKWKYRQMKKRPKGYKKGSFSRKTEVDKDFAIVQQFAVQTLHG